MIKTGVLFVSILFQTMVAMALKPDSVYVSTPYALGLKFQHTILPTTDGAEIDIWQIFADSTVKNNTTLIVAYGDAGNKSHWLNQAALMSKLGYDLVLFDYRGFGKSSPFEMNPNQLYYPEFVTDLTTVMQWNKIQYPKNKTGIWALSMGTIMATIAAQTEPVDFLIAEGFVADPAAIQKKIFEVKKKEIVLPQGDERYKEQVRKQRGCKTTQEPFVNRFRGWTFTRISNNDQEFYRRSVHECDWKIHPQPLETSLFQPTYSNSPNDLFRWGPICSCAQTRCSLSYCLSKQAQQNN
jgi:pimeloyl-ACP methyl ester carboxylesterase